MTWAAAAAAVGALGQMALQGQRGLLLGPLWTKQLPAVSSQQQQQQAAQRLRMTAAALRPTDTAAVVQIELLV
jgi:hypothetical protein